MSRNDIKIPLRFAVTVDTEADDAWESPDEIRLSNIRQLDRFQDLCDQYGIVPTYLLTYECATRDESLSVLKPIAEQRRCEIGHHLHVWTTPPYQCPDKQGIDHDWVHAYQFELPELLFIEKAESLRRAIELNFGKSPTSHRAGRWGIDQRTVDWMIRSGFVAETSMCTGIRVRQFLPNTRLTGEDGSPIRCAEYELNKNPYLWEGRSNDSKSSVLVELPATVDIRLQAAASVFQQFLKHKTVGEFLAFKLYRKLAGLKRLSPNPSYPPGELPRIIDRAISNGVTCINLMLHSSELALYCSPFTRNESDQKRVWLHIEEAFRHIRTRQITSSGISELAHLVRGQAGLDRPIDSQTETKGI